MRIKSCVCLVIWCILSFALCGCVNQYPENTETQKDSMQTDEISSERETTGNGSVGNSDADNL